MLREAEKRGLELDVVHTGQHYDYEMSRVFFNELTVPDPVVNLGWVRGRIRSRREGCSGGW